MTRRSLPALAILFWTPSALSQSYGDDGTSYREPQNDWVWDLMFEVGLVVVIILILIAAAAYFRRLRRRFESMADASDEKQAQATARIDDSLALQREGIAIAKNGAASNEKLIELCEQSLLEQRKANELLERLVDANRKTPD